MAGWICAKPYCEEILRLRAPAWFLSSEVPETLLFHKNFNKGNDDVTISPVEIFVE
jgi:hypothetical protein